MRDCMGHMMFISNEGHHAMKTHEELRAMAYNLADEIETRAAPRIKAGLSRERALMLTIMEMGGKISVVKG